MTLTLEIQKMDLGVLCKTPDGKKLAITDPKDLANAVEGTILEASTRILKTLDGQIPSQSVSITLIVETSEGTIEDDATNSKFLQDFITRLQNNKPVSRDDVKKALVSLGGERVLSSEVKHDNSQNSGIRVKENDKTLVVNSDPVIVNKEVKHDSSNNSNQRLPDKNIKSGERVLN